MKVCGNAYAFLSFSQEHLDWLGTANQLLLTGSRSVVFFPTVKIASKRTDVAVSLKRYLDDRWTNNRALISLMLPAPMKDRFQFDAFFPGIPISLAERGLL